MAARGPKGAGGHRSDGTAMETDRRLSALGDEINGSPGRVFNPTRLDRLPDCDGWQTVQGRLSGRPGTWHGVVALAHQPQPASLPGGEIIIGNTHPGEFAELLLQITISLDFFDEGHGKRLCINRFKALTQGWPGQDIPYFFVNTGATISATFSTPREPMYPPIPTRSNCHMSSGMARAGAASQNSERYGYKI